MAYRNIKVEFEYLGVEYPGIAVEDGIEIHVSQTSIDGFPAFTTFVNAGPAFPTFNVDGIASISKNSSATPGYLVLAYVAP